MQTDQHFVSKDIDAARVHTSDLILVLVYAGFTSLWILLSDQVLEWLLDDAADFALASNFKGWVFVALTSLLLYGLLKRRSRETRESRLGRTHGRTPNWLFVLFAAVTIGLSTATIVYTINKQKKEEAARLLAVVHLKSQLIQDWLNERHADANVLHATPFFAELYRHWRIKNDNAARDRLISLLNRYRESYEYNDVLLFDGPSKLVWSADKEQVYEESILHDPMIRALDEAEVKRLGPYRTADGSARLDFIVPLSKFNDDQRPVVVLSMDPDNYLYALLRDWHSPIDTSELLMFRHDADHIQFLNDLKYPSEVTTNRYAPIAMEKLLAAQGAVDENNRGRPIEGVDYRGVAVFGTVLPVAGTDWFLVAKTDLEELHRQIGGPIRWIILIGLLSLVAVWTAMHLVRQRHALALATKDLERDDLIHQVSTMAHIGGWKFDPATGRGNWTEETARIHEMPTDQLTDIESALNFFEGESRDRVDAAIDKAANAGIHYDVELELITAKGNRKWVRMIGGPEQPSNETIKLRGAIQDITVQKQTAMLLERERSLFKTLIQTLPDLIWLKDLDGVFITCNPRIEQLYGASEAEIIGKTDYDFADRELADFFRAKDRAAAAAGKPTVNLERIPFADGHTELVETTKMPMRDSQGNLIGVLGIARDITAQHEAQEALRESEAQTRLLLESTAEAIYGVDEEGKFTFVNPSCLRLLGYEHDEDLLGKHSHSLIHHSHADGSPYPACECRVYQTFKNDQGVHVDDEVFWQRDGTPIPVEYWSYPIHRDGKTVGTVVAWFDISERRAAEAQLRKLSQAVEQSFESFIITDRKGNIEYVNKAFRDNTGYTNEEVIGQNPRILQSGKTPKKTFKALWNTIGSGRPWKGTLYNRRKDGSEYVEFVFISPIRQEDGRITHYVAAQEDVTERQRADEELKQYRFHLEELVEERTKALAEARQRADAANQAKSAFLANMSHEIRTPMNGVIGLLDVLERSSLSDQQNDLVTIIRQSAGTLLGVIDDVLDFSKIEAGRMELELAPLSVADLVESVCTSLAVAAARRGIELHVFVDPQIPSQVFADGLRLRQVLYNLIGNALKFTGGQASRQGCVWVTAERTQHEPLRLRFTVEDNGIGMAPEKVEHLFDAFTQAEVSTTRRFGGTGLGLTICKRIVELMDGTIDVASELDAGANFAVELPLETLSDENPKNDVDLAGVHCILHGKRHRDTEGIGIYLRHAGAQISQISSMDQLTSVSMAPTATNVIICTDNTLPAATSGKHARPPTDIPILFIGYGKQRPPCTERPNTITINGNGLRRKTLLRNVAVAAGRAQPSASDSNGDTPQDRQFVAPTVAEARDQGRLILIAEDDTVNQTVILQQLTLMGYAAEVANNGIEALEKWRKGGYALLLTDLHMPEMDGYELATKIRHEETGGRLPIVVLTANALHGEEQYAAAAGVDDYLTKPVQLDRLEHALERWLPHVSATQRADFLPTIIEATHQQTNPALDIIDLAVLKGLVGDDVAVINKLLSSYDETAKEYAQALQTSYEDDDLAEVGRVAHKLKSASRSIGATAFGDLCANIESAAKNGLNESLQPLMTKFKDNFMDVGEALEMLLSDS